MGNPLAAMLVQKLAAGMGGGGMGGPDMGGPGGPPPDMGGGPGGPGGSPLDAQYGSEIANLRQTDPAGLVKALTAMKQQVVALVSQTGMSAPAVARALAKMLGDLDGAIKEAGTLAATAAVAGPPIQSSLLPDSTGMGAGAPM